MANRAFIRFTNITIPNYSIVANVFVRFTAYSNKSDVPVNLRCAFVTEDNPDAPVSFAELQSYTLTDWVSWNSLASWSDGSVYDTPSLTEIFQSIIGRAGWVSRNAAILIVEDVSSSGQRGFTSVRFTENDERAILFVTYTARESFPVGESGYVFCGRSASYLQDCDEYDPDTWTNKTDAPSPVRVYLAASTILNKGYVYGGSDGSGYLQDCSEFDFDIWSSKTDMPSPGRALFAATTILDKGYVFGGYIVSNDDIRDTDEYDPDTWTAKTDMPLPTRYGLSASTINDKGYVFRGYSLGGAGLLNDTDEYDPDTWVSKTNASVKRTESAASTILNKGYIFCGGDFSSGRHTDEYDPDTWTAKTDAPLPSRRFLAASTISDKGYIYGGLNVSTPVQDCDEYTTDTWWASKSDMPSPARYGLAATTI